MPHKDELSEDSDIPELSEVSDCSDNSDNEEQVEPMNKQNKLVVASTNKQNDSNSDPEDEQDELDEPIIDMGKNKTNIIINSINETYSLYLKNNKLLLNPEYQRGICWTVKKMNTFIDTIMKNFIVPSFVIYKLSDIELDEDIEHFYECIDGQNRFIALLNYIEAKPINGKYVYWKNNDERVYYNMETQELQRLRRRYPKSRNLTKQEKSEFDNFKFSFHIIETVNKDDRLSLEEKCSIFNRLQNGTPVIAWIKLRNMNNPITMTICKYKLLDKMNEIGFIDRMYLKNIPKEAETFNIYFLIRTFLIIDKKNLEINYLDMNIRKYLEENDYKGTPSVQITSDIDKLVPNVIKIIEFISNRKIDILPELAYIYVCYYANNKLGKLRKLIEYFKNNDKVFQKYNNYKTYRKTLESVTPTDKMFQIYTEISNINIQSSNTITA